jgi:hypothetical protein
MRFHPTPTPQSEPARDPTPAVTQPGREALWQGQVNSRASPLTGKDVRNSSQHDRN